MTPQGSPICFDSVASAGEKLKLRIPSSPTISLVSGVADFVADGNRAATVEKPHTDLDSDAISREQEAVNVIIPYLSPVGKG